MTIDLSNLNSTTSSMMSQLPIALSVSHSHHLDDNIDTFLYRIQTTRVNLGPDSRVLMTSERIGSSLTQCERVSRSDDRVLINTGSRIKCRRGNEN